MSMTGKISKKKVDNYAWGEKITFLVNGKWISALVNKNNPPSPEMAELLRNLQEGDEAQFEIVEAPNKTDPSKPPYLNIAGIERVHRIGGDTGEPQNYSVGSPPSAPRAESNRVDAPKETGDTRVRSMALAYAKDWGIAHKTDSQMMDREEIVRIAKRFEQYILTGE